MQHEVAARAEKDSAYKDDMRRATIHLDTLEQQQKELMRQFKARTGRPYAMLLEQYKVRRELVGSPAAKA